MPTAPKIPTIQAPATGEVTVRAKLKAFGKTWRLVRPNAVLSGEMAGAEGGAELLNDYFVGHIHPDEREAFFAAVKADPSVDMVYLMELLEQMQEAVYAEEIDAEPTRRRSPS